MSKNTFNNTGEKLIIHFIGLSIWTISKFFEHSELFGTRTVYIKKVIKNGKIWKADQENFKVSSKQSAKMSVNLKLRNRSFSLIKTIKQLILF